MNLAQRERDKLMIALAALIARQRLARGIKLNYPESIAIIADFVLEGAREEACWVKCLYASSVPPSMPSISLAIAVPSALRTQYWTGFFRAGGAAQHESG